MAMETNEAKKGGPASQTDTDRILRDLEAKIGRMEQELRGVSQGAARPSAQAQQGNRPIFISGGPSAAPSLDRVIDDSLRSLLGVVPKPGEPDALVELLNRVFIAAEADGKRSWKLRPVSYSPRLESSETLTGVQASIFARAKERLDNSKGAFASLRGIRPDRDDEAIEAAKSLLLSKWEQFVAELGNPAGVNIPRANQLREEIAYNRADTDPSKAIFSYITTLGVQLGIFRATGDVPELSGNQPVPTRRYAITTPDDTALTAFLLVRGDIEATLKEYDDYKTLLADDLGARVSSIKRILEAVDETLQATMSALETLNFTAVERRTFTIKLGPGSNQTISFEDLLSWTGNFVRFEAVQAMDSAGRWGIVSLRRTSATLATLLGKASAAPNIPLEVANSNVPTYLQEMQQYLEQVQTEAETESKDLKSA